MNFDQMFKAVESAVNSAVTVVQTNRAKAGFLLGFLAGVSVMVLV